MMQQGRQNCIESVLLLCCSSSRMREREKKSQLLIFVGVGAGGCLLHLWLILEQSARPSCLCVCVCVSYRFSGPGHTHARTTQGTQYCKWGGTERDGTRTGCKGRDDGGRERLRHCVKAQKRTSWLEPSRRRSMLPTGWGGCKHSQARGGGRGEGIWGKPIGVRLIYFLTG